MTVTELISGLESAFGRLEQVPPRVIGEAIASRIILRDWKNRPSLYAAQAAEALMMVLSLEEVQVDRAQTLIYETICDEVAEFYELQAEIGADS